MNRKAGMDASNTGISSDLPILRSVKKKKRKAGMDASGTGIASDPNSIHSFGRTLMSTQRSDTPWSFINPKSSESSTSMYCPPGPPSIRIYDPKIAALFLLRKTDGLTDGNFLSFPLSHRPTGWKDVRELTKEELDNLYCPKTTMSDEEYAAIHREQNLKRAEVALEAYNAANGVDFELVDSGCGRYFHAVLHGDDGIWYHINFKARSKSSGSGDHSVKLFFAELKPHLEEMLVNLCVCLDPDKSTDGRCLCWTDIDKNCEDCGAQILHPSRGPLEAGYHLVADLVKSIRGLRKKSTGTCHAVATIKDFSQKYSRKRFHFI